MTEIGGEEIESVTDEFEYIDDTKSKDSDKHSVL